MDSKMLNTLIKYIDEKLKTYSIKFNSEKKSIENQLSNSIHLLNERTIAAVANYYIGEFLSETYKEKCKLKVNEFPICLLNEINGLEKIELNNEVDNQGIYHKWKNCYVDGYFKVQDLHFTGDNSVFIEYKLDKKFRFVQLATDYLKYKIYTKNDNSRTIFLFVIFDKNENYPSIISGEEPYFCRLNQKITVNSLMESRVFVFVPKQDEKDNLDLDFLNEVYDGFNIISEKADEINQIGINKFQEYDDYQKIFIENMEKYNSRVIKANYIRQNYKFIWTLWNSSCRVLKEDKVYKDLNFADKSSENVLKLIDDGSKYNANFEYNFHRKNKIQAQINGLKVSNFSSFNMIVFLDFFNDIVNATDERPIYFKTKSGRRKNDEIIDYLDIAKKHKEKLFEIYGVNEEGINKVKRLGLEVLYFLINIYPLLFDISDTHQVIDSSDNKKINENLKVIQKTINIIRKKTKYSNKINVVDLSNQADDQIAGLVQHVISKY